MKCPEKSNPLRQKDQVLPGLGSQEEGILVKTKGYRVSSGGDENVLKLQWWIGQLCEYTPNQRILCFKWVNHMTCEYYLKLLTRKLAANCLKNNPPMERWSLCSLLLSPSGLATALTDRIWLKWPCITSEAPPFSSFHLVLSRHWFLKHSLSESNCHAVWSHIERPQIIRLPGDFPS